MTPATFRLLFLAATALVVLWTNRHSRWAQFGGLALCIAAVGYIEAHP
jgi:hypothetical protein